MSTVWVPQQPSRFDHEFNIWVPIIDLKSASKFGNIDVLLPPGMSSMALDPIKRALKEKLAASTADDYLVAVGDPAIITLCGIILAQKHSKLNMLKWDKKNEMYFNVEVEI